MAFLLADRQEVERVARPLLARTADPDRAAEIAWLLAFTLVMTGQFAAAAEHVGTARLKTFCCAAA